MYSSNIASINPNNDLARSGFIRYVCTILLFAMVLGTNRSAAQADPVLFENNVKAAFAFNFIKFIDWPSNAFDNADMPIVVKVLGADGIASAMEDAVRDKKAHNRSVIVRRLTRVEEIGDGSACHLLFVGRSEQARLADIFRRLEKEGVVTVADSEGFLDQGGMINFVMESNKVRFEINAVAAERAGLTISSQLLKLAIRVVPATLGKEE